MHPLLTDPWFAARLDAALAPHQERLTDRQRAALRQKIAWVFCTHPTTRRILLRERPSLAAAIGSSPIDKVVVDRLPLRAELLRATGTGDTRSRKT